MATINSVDKSREGRKPLQFFPPENVKYNFKMACLKIGKPMNEVLLNLVHRFIKEGK